MTTSTAIPAPEVPGSVSGAPGLPDGFSDTFTSQLIDTGSVRLHAVIGGDGPPLLLVHGWPETWYAWRLLMPTLARDFTVIAVDQRGIGLSDKPRDGYDTATLANDLVGLMDALGHDRFAIVGHDTGFAIAYAVAADHPDRVDRAALAEIPGPPGSILTRAAGWPIISAVVICVVVFFLLGGPLCLRSLGDTSVLPGASTLARVADQAIFGWKDLLTTLPPIDGDGPLLVLPWLAGMLAGLVGLGLAHLPVRRAWLAAALPVLGMTVVLSGAILLGVRHPQSLLLQGSLFAGLALAWLAVRARRASAAVKGGSTSYVRGVGAVAMLALAAGVAFPASALIAGDDDERAVARNWVEPPFDIGRYPSPLAGFRKYVDLKGDRPDQRLRQDAARRRGRPGRHPGPLRHDGPLRRHGLGCHRQRPARAGRRLLPAGVLHDRQPGRRRRGGGRARHHHARRGLDGRVAADRRRAPVDDLRDRRRARQGRGVPLQPRDLDGGRAERSPAG